MPSRAVKENDTKGQSMDIRTPRCSRPSGNNTSTTVSGSKKRKSSESELMVTLMEILVSTNKPIAMKAEKNEAWLIEQVIKVLNEFDELDEVSYYKALRHFRNESHRCTFLALSVF